MEVKPLDPIYYQFSVRINDSKALSLHEEAKRKTAMVRYFALRPEARATGMSLEHHWLTLRTQAGLMAPSGGGPAPARDRRALDNGRSPAISFTDEL
eukprot:311070-Rhodomonas_salina.1